MARNRSPSPIDNMALGPGTGSPQPQVSKRDKRRNMLADKLSEMMASFSDNRDSHYRAQLSALQADINLILKADPYMNKPLDDAGEEATELVGSIMGSNVPNAPSAGTDYAAQCGKYYGRFVDSVNDAMEDRDRDLTMLWVSILTPSSYDALLTISRRTSTKTLETRSITPTFTRCRSPKKSISSSLPPSASALWPPFKHEPCV